MISSFDPNSRTVPCTGVWSSVLSGLGVFLRTLLSLRRFEGWDGTRVAVDEEGFVTIAGAGGGAVLVEGTVEPFDIVGAARSGLEVERCGGV